MSSKSYFSFLIFSIYLIFCITINAENLHALNQSKMKVQIAGYKNSHSKILTAKKTVRIIGTTLPNQAIVMSHIGAKRHKSRVRTSSSGNFTMKLKLDVGVNTIHLSVPAKRRLNTKMIVISTPFKFSRSFDGSPVKNTQPFARIIPASQSYLPGLKPRKDTKILSVEMAEDISNPSFSSNIPLGLVFFGQFVDHDLDLNNSQGQGPSADVLNPINMRTPALDLDSLYGKGPLNQPEFYTDDGLFFRLGNGGNDLLRNEKGVAIIGDGRNDENGFIGAIHLSFQKYHNSLMKKMLNGMSPGSLTSEEKTALFDQVRNELIQYYQGIVANEMSIAFAGIATPDNMPAIVNIPVEFAAAAYRLGHTLVPNQVVVDDIGTRKSPVDPELRKPGTLIRLDLLFGSKAQKAAGFDDKISQVMRELLIPVSPTQPNQGNMVGGNAPNIGGGIIIDGVLHLDLIETNLLRGREQKLPSGQEYAAFILGLKYDPNKHGNTDLWQYILKEASSFGHLGLVGSDIYYRTIGGVISADPYRYNNSNIF